MLTQCIFTYIFRTMDINVLPAVALKEQDWVNEHQKEVLKIEVSYFITSKVWFRTRTNQYKV